MHEVGAADRAPAPVLVNLADLPGDDRLSADEWVALQPLVVLVGYQEALCRAVEDGREREAGPNGLRSRYWELQHYRKGMRSLPDRLTDSNVEQVLRRRLGLAQQVQEDLELWFSADTVREWQDDWVSVQKSVAQWRALVEGDAFR